MRRRIVVGYLVLTAVVLLALEVPLGLSLARRERDTRAAAATRDASTVASLADEAVEHPAAHDLAGLIGQYRDRAGTEIVIVDRSGRLLASTTTPADAAEEPEAEYGDGIRSALAGHVTSGRHHDDGGKRRFVAVPIGSTSAVDGAVLLTYPVGPIETRVNHIWLALSGLAALVLAVAAAAGAVVALSVVRPLARLDDAAVALGRGDLDVRTDAHRGPREVQLLAASFNDMAARLGELVGAQRRFLADASHQLRTPLTALRLRLEGIDPDAPDAADLEAAVREVHRLSRLVDGLLQLARVEGSAPRREAIDVVATALERRDAWEPLAEERGVRLLVTAPTDEPVLALAVPGALDQVLDNLIANSIDVTPSGRAITIDVDVDVTAAKRQVAIVVTDEGPGMTAEERAHAFDRFWHGRRNRRDGGTGLGLAIARQLVVASGGRVELGEAERGGLQVMVVLETAQAVALA